jgi:recombination protein RecA
MSESVNKFIAAVKKNIKGVHVSVMTESDIANITETIKTPALDLNRILSGNLSSGIPTRAVVGIAGPEGSFKSSFAILCAADASRNGFQPILIDTEGGLKTEFCNRWGLDTSKAVYFYSQWVEEIMVFLAQLKDSGMEKMIIVLDSVGGLDRMKTYEDALEGDPKADQGQLQRNIKTIIKMLTGICVLQNSIAILTGHMYGAPGSIGKFAKPDEVGGGKAFKYLPSIFIQLKKSKMQDEDKNVTGNAITAYTTKNRFYPAFQEAVIEIDYKNGINQYAGILNLAVEAGIVDKAGSWYSYKDERLGQGEANSMEVLKNKTEFSSRIIDELNEWLKTTGYSTVNENLKLAEEMDLKEEDPDDLNTPDEPAIEEKPKKTKKTKIK